MPESSIERQFCKKLREWGSEHRVHLEVLKFSVPGFAGWPDRLILWQGGGLMFIEFKDVGESPRRLQEYVHDVIRKLGFEVRVYDNWRIALEEVTGKIQSQILSAKRDEANRR